MRINNAIRRYEVLYKCPICGCIQILNDPFDCTEQQAEQFIMQFLRNQQFAGSAFYKAPMYVQHKCADGSLGLSPFIGLRCKRK